MLNKEDKKYIKENYLIKTNKQLAKDLNEDIDIIIKYLHDNKLSRRLPFYLKENEYLEDIENFSKYQISNFGRIKKLKDNTEIRPSLTPDGYQSIKLVNDDGKRCTIRLNRLVAKIFIPNHDKDKIEVNHIDGNKLNNSVDNLEWVTPSENQKHAYKNNLRKPISRKQCIFTKYTEEQVRELCVILEDDFNQSSTQIMKKLSYKTSSGFINSIKNKKRWKDIIKDYNF